jgi:hypothetical protein
VDETIFASASEALMEEDLDGSSELSPVSWRQTFSPREFDWLLDGSDQL